MCYKIQPPFIAEPLNFIVSLQHHNNIKMMFIGCIRSVRNTRKTLPSIIIINTDTDKRFIQIRSANDIISILHS